MPSVLVPPVCLYIDRNIEMPPIPRYVIIAHLEEHIRLSKTTAGVFWRHEI